MFFRVLVLVVFCTILSTGYCYGQQKPISQLIRELSSLDQTSIDDELDKFYQNRKSTPVIEQNTAYFIVRSMNGEQPYIRADFNGFLHPRYVPEQSIGKMNRIGSSDWYYHEQPMNMDAMVNYRFKMGDLDTLDVLNPNIRMSFGSQYSYVTMPEFKTDNKIGFEGQINNEQLIRHEFKSEIMGHNRNVHVYLPPDYNSSNRYPSIYFHDGSIYINNGRVPQILDQLIESKQIEPIIAVFDDPVVRGKEYRNDLGFRQYISSELIPFIDKNYSTRDDADTRAVVGGSRGGQSALYLSHNTNKFKKCGAFSPAIHPTATKDFTSQLSSVEYAPSEVFISGSVYDFIWFQDALDLKSTFENSGVRFKYEEISQGHNIPAWRSLFDEMLIFFFPVKS